MSTPSPAPRRLECDLLVIGSGAGGLSAAVTAAWHGLKVIVAEKEAVLGGTTAWSGGWMWAPLNPLAQRAGIVEDPEAPRTYLRHVLGNNFDEAKVDAFLEAAPRMVAFFEQHTALQFEGGYKIPDTYGNVPGAGTGGRSVIAAPYDARGLGELVTRLRRPMRETTFMGMTIQAGPDLAAFMNVTRSPRAFAPCCPALRPASGRSRPAPARACSCATASLWWGGSCAPPPISGSICGPPRRRCGCCGKAARSAGRCWARPRARWRSAHGGASCSRPAASRTIPSAAAPCSQPTRSI